MGEEEEVPGCTGIRRASSTSLVFIEARGLHGL